MVEHTAGPLTLTSPDRERPSRHGLILGEALAALAKIGREGAPELPEMCATCAFREGCMTNQMASTGLTALNCVLGIDKDRFACHHGMRDGEPTRICAGYIAARVAPWSLVQRVVEWLNTQLTSLEGPDDVRAAFDIWVATVDPHGEMDDYRRGRAYLRAALDRVQP